MPITIPRNREISGIGCQRPNTVQPDLNETGAGQPNTIKKCHRRLVYQLSGDSGSHPGCISVRGPYSHLAIACGRALRDQGLFRFDAGRCCCRKGPSAVSSQLSADQEKLSVASGRARKQLNDWKVLFVLEVVLRSVFSLDGGSPPEDFFDPAQGFFVRESKRPHWQDILSHTRCGLCLCGPGRDLKNVQLSCLVPAMPG